MNQMVTSQKGFPNELKEKLVEAVVVYEHSLDIAHSYDELLKVDNLN